MSKTNHNPWKLKLQKLYIESMCIKYNKENIEQLGLDWANMELIAETPECYIISYEATDPMFNVKFINIVFKNEDRFEAIQIN